MVQKRLSIHGQSPLNRFFLSHLTLLFSIQSTFRERRFMIHLKYFLQIYPLKIWWIQKKVVPLHPLLNRIVVSTEHMVLSADGLH